MSRPQMRGYGPGYTTRTREFEWITFTGQGAHLWAETAAGRFQPCEGGGTRGATVTLERHDPETCPDPVKTAARRWIRQRRAAGLHLTEAEQ